VDLKATCPHCSKDIDLVKKADFEGPPWNLSDNQQQHLRDQGKFVRPWLDVGSAFLYLREEALRWWEESVRKNVESSIEQALEKRMSPEEKEIWLEELRKRLEESETESKK